jgi:putative aminopeptidase FrvX
MRKESLNFFKKLLTAVSPSGFEQEAQKIWCQYARQYADKVYTDSYGNAVAVINPEGSPKVMLNCHIDEIGLMVKHIDEKGFIYVQSIGGVDPSMIRSKRINIYNEKGTVRGVVAAPAIHLRDRANDPKPPKMHEIFIDIGAKNAKEAAKRISVGDPAVFVDDFEMLTKDVAIARALDNKAGSWAIIEALRLASTKKLSCALYACSSVQEEVGLAGAHMQADSVKPDIAIAVDVTHATDIPGVNHKEHGEIKQGEGPTIAIGRENHPVLIKKIRAVAKKKKIPLQIETFSKTGGTNALAIWLKNGGTPSAIVSIPTRYMHTTVEMINLTDLERTAELLSAFCVDVKKNEQFKVKI